MPLGERSTHWREIADAWPCCRWVACLAMSPERGESIEEVGSHPRVGQLHLPQSSAAFRAAC